MLEMKEKTMKSQEKTSRLEDALTNVRTSQQREQFLKQYTEDGYDRFADYLNEYMAEHDIDLAELGVEYLSGLPVRQYDVPSEFSLLPVFV